MNQLIVYEREIVNNLATIAKKDALHFSSPISSHERISHLQDVLRARIGDTLKIFIPNQSRRIAKIIQLDDNTCTLELGPPLLEVISPFTHLHLLIGISRPLTMKKIFEHATAMGVAQLHFFLGEKSEKSYLQSPLIKSKEYLRFIEQGLSQSSRYFKHPQVEFHSYLKELALPPIANRFYLESSAKATLQTEQHLLASPTLLAIGPERGYSENELATLKQKEFQGVRISQSILRVEMALFYALAQLEFIHLHQSCS
ncbi:MAG: 16S rRNA (uracil(1498)-N(3))-methyltransferase [Oligoflexia bacterium]|nr:16S rRNA (uracil(1498)-N(3))-methyltransferase [Oligoflexia bacterium]MBF0364426.1 16S rRNA (uracil(1498)-N(3))-methyltransferase [Oligoflexia bacterium]